jgi:hypothetical protein
MAITIANDSNDMNEKMQCTCREPAMNLSRRQMCPQRVLPIAPKRVDVKTSCVTLRPLRAGSSRTARGTASVSAAGGGHSRPSARAAASTPAPRTTLRSSPTFAPSA